MTNVRVSKAGTGKDVENGNSRQIVQNRRDFKTEKGNSRQIVQNRRDFKTEKGNSRQM